MTYSTFLFKKLGLLIIFLAFCAGIPARDTDVVNLALGDEVRNLYIFSIGINKYEQQDSLKFAIKDAEDLAREFQTRGKYKFKEIKTVLLTNDQARKAAIIQEFDRLASEISSNDVFIFTYSGMGGAVKIGGGDAFYLLPADGSGTKFTEKALLTSKLQAMFRKIRAKRKLIILDACDSATGFESALSAFVEPDANVKKLVKDDLTFIGTQTYSFDILAAQNGSVTSVVLNGLKGGADLDEDGEISFEELALYTNVDSYKYSKIHNVNFRIRTFMQGSNFKIAATDQKLKEIAKVESQKKDSDSVSNRITERGQVAVQEKGKTKTGRSERQGKDYAILFANQNYRQDGYNGLNNPINDITDIKKELEDRYGFQVIVKKDLTTKEIYKTIEDIEAGNLAPLNKEKINVKEDQLFFFFAGHGYTDQENQGFYVGQDSPYPFTDEESGKFVRLDRLITGIERLPIEHIMVVFDACYAGQIWKPKVKLVQDYGYNQINSGETLASLFAPANYTFRSGPQAGFDSDSFGSVFNTDFSKLVYAKEKMNNRSRIIITSGARPVPDASVKADNSLSSNSPFAEAFLKVLRENGGEDEVLITPEFIPKIDKLNPKPQTGALSNTDGDFVFIKKD